MSTKAEEMAKKQRDISVAEFFEKNRHLLGFDNKRKALLTAVKEAVDNSLDACEEAGILPELSVELIDMGNDRFRVIVEDNGPGIPKTHISKVFARLLYGSKFHRLKQSRGQQGIGISASVMYSQLTTGRPARVISKIAPNKPAHFMEVGIDTSKNEPVIFKDEEKEWDKATGTRIEMDMEGQYLKGAQSVDEYLKETAIVNPHVLITYVNPKAEQIIFPRATEMMPVQPKEIKPHPYGIELGMLQKMMSNTDERTVQSFLSNDFSRVSSDTAKLILDEARVVPNLKPKDVSRDDAEKIINVVKKIADNTLDNIKIMNPPTDCISPLGEEMFEKGMKKEVNAEFYVAVTRKPAVYRGNPFVVEVALAYGGNQKADGAATVLRFANRVALLYQQGACGVTKSIVQTNWKPYGLQQSSGALPMGALTIAVHIASVWVPFTSESKEAIAHYPEIISEIKLALQEAGRKLQTYVHKKHKVQNQLERANLFERYIPEVAYSLAKLTGDSKDAIERKLREMVNKSEIQAQIHQMESLKGEADETFAKGEDDDGSDDNVESDLEDPKKKKKDKKSKQDNADLANAADARRLDED